MLCVEIYRPIRHVVESGMCCETAAYIYNALHGVFMPLELFHVTTVTNTNSMYY